MKNTSQVCSDLWKIKHLIEVVPIDMPKKLPEDVDSISSYLHESGKLYIFPKIDKDRYEATEKFHTNVKKMNGGTLRRVMRQEWLTQ